MYPLPLSGTHFLTALVSVNLLLEHRKRFISNRHPLTPPSDHINPAGSIF